MVDRLRTAIANHRVAVPGAPRPTGQLFGIVARPG